MHLTRDFTSLRVAGPRTLDWTERGGREELEQDRLDRAYVAGQEARKRGELWVSRRSLDLPPDEVEEWGKGWDDMDQKMTSERSVDEGEGRIVYDDD